VNTRAKEKICIPGEQTEPNQWDSKSIVDICCSKSVP